MPCFCSTGACRTLEAGDWVGRFAIQTILTNFLVELSSSLGLPKPIQSIWLLNGILTAVGRMLFQAIRPPEAEAERVLGA